MKREQMNQSIVIVLLVLLIYQISMNLFYKQQREFSIEKNNVYNETIEEFSEDINVLEILDTINKSYININNLKKENNKWRSSITLNGEEDQLLEYINMLEELEVNVINYRMEKNENVMVYLDVVFP